MTTELKNKAELLLKSLLRIKEVAKTDIINSDDRNTQISKIESIINKHKDSQPDLNEVFILTKEEFGGSFGLLSENSPLRKELMNHYEIMEQARLLLKTEILTKYIINSEFCSQPLVKYTERHGGPLWFDLEQIKINFLANDILEIKYDSSLSKSMSPIKKPFKIEQAKYRIELVMPKFISGSIVLSDGRRFGFETLEDMDFILLDSPQIWKESIVVKRSTGIDIAP